MDIVYDGREAGPFAVVEDIFSGKAVSQGFSALSLNILDQVILVGRNILCIVECLASYFPPSIAALCSRASISKKIAQNKRQ